MGAIVNGTLKNKESWYRPLFFCTKRKDYQISGFVIFDANKHEVIVKIDVGWINDTCKEIPGIDMERKSEIALDMERPYFIPCRDKSRTGLDGKGTYTVYVPIGEFAEISGRKTVERKCPDMGIMVHEMAHAVIFGQHTEVCLSSEMRYYKSYQKREEICRKEGISDTYLVSALKDIREKGYSIEELLEDK